MVRNRPAAKKTVSAFAKSVFRYQKSTKPPKIKAIIANPARTVAPDDFGTGKFGENPYKAGPFAFRCAETLARIPSSDPISARMAATAEKGSIFIANLQKRLSCQLKDQD